MTIKGLRTKLCMTQAELATRAHVSPALVNIIERYDYAPGSRVKGKIANALGVPSESLWPEVEAVKNGNS